MGIVDIIIPVYNTDAKLLKIAVESAIDQKYVERIIIIDDGSKIDTANVCDEIALNSSRVEVYHQKNQGAATARNKGIELASSEWIMFLDADDELKHNAVDMLYREATDYSDIISCCCDVNTGIEVEKNSFFSEKKIVFKTMEDKRRLFVELVSDAKSQGGGRYTAIGVPWGKLYRHSFLIDNNLKFDKNLYRQEDNAFNVRAFTKAREIIYIDEPLCIYNYKHISGLYNGYDPKLVSLYAYLWKDWEEFIFQNYSSDQALWDCFYKQVIMQVYALSRRYIFNPANEQDCSSKLDALKKILVSETVIEACKRKCLNENKKEKIKRLILKYKLTFVMKIIADLSCRK